MTYKQEQNLYITVQGIEHTFFYYLILERELRHQVKTEKT
jgi:hypothetical protein